MELMVAILVGALAGTHTATWGMYKDAPHEGFEVRKYFRSIVMSAAIAPVVVAVTQLSTATAGGLVALFAVTYAVERAINEFHKTFLRQEDQSKYFIPMQLAVNGKVVESYAARVGAGAAVAGGAGALLLFGLAVQAQLSPPSPLPVVVAFGSIGGWVSAVGGALKDAPHEGFELRKFFRSPVLSALYALLLYSFTHSLVLSALGGLGLTIATLETYKTFFFPSKPRGKFAGKPVLYPGEMVRRNRFVPLYVAIWVVVIAGAIAGLAA